MIKFILFILSIFILKNRSHGDWYVSGRGGLQSKKCVGLISHLETLMLQLWQWPDLEGTSQQRGLSWQGRLSESGQPKVSLAEKKPRDKCPDLHSPFSLAPHQGFPVGALNWCSPIRSGPEDESRAKSAAEWIWWSKQKVSGFLTHIHETSLCTRDPAKSGQWITTDNWSTILSASSWSGTPLHKHVSMPHAHTYMHMQTQRHIYTHTHTYHIYSQSTEAPPAQSKFAEDKTNRI